ALCNLRIYRQCFWMFSEKTSAGEAEASFRREYPKALVGSMQLNNNLSYNGQINIYKNNICFLAIICYNKR
ncbi:MAG: hypothetical protein IKV73_03625, partial [Clostridia bacterium]|nr:hypothetical protein [Clostridia bacterium]